ncbi:MAG: glycosyltransferase [Alteraurantiacibacter sp. bin_em_oilr2.035]|nr:glycosyltransferase [Alteraurantiacibacter sp. bin_em_oilr2.035]
MQANFVGEQAAAWRKARPDHRITILAPHSPGIARHDEVAGASVTRFPYFVPSSAQRLAYPAIMPNLKRNPLLWAQVPPFILAEYVAATQIAKKICPRVIYAHWVMPQGLVAWRLWREMGIPYILQNHSSDLAVFDKAGGIGRKLARVLLREASHYFCVNASQRDHALSLFDGADREAMAARCTVLPMGIATDDAQALVPGKQFEIATISRLSRKKGLDLLIRAAEALAAKGVRPRIAIAGDGEERARLESMVVEADITFTGFLAGERKDRFLASAERFVFPALAADGDVEGMPVAMLEAMARGRPVLVSRDTNVELLPEWPEIRDELVFVESPSDIAALAEGLEKLLEIGPSEELRRLIDRYRWTNLIHDYLAPIEAALN